MHSTTALATVQVNSPPAFQALYDYEGSLVSCVAAPLQVRRGGEQIEWKGGKIKELYAVDERWLRTEVKSDSQVWRIKLLRWRWRKHWLREQTEFFRNTNLPSRRRFRRRPDFWWAQTGSVQKAAAMVGRVKRQVPYCSQLWRLADDTQVWREHSCKLSGDYSHSIRVWENEVDKSKITSKKMSFSELTKQINKPFSPFPQE